MQLKTWISVFAAASLFGCEGRIQSPDGEGPGTGPNCSDSLPDPGAQPLRRLSAAQYENTVRALLPMVDNVSLDASALLVIRHIVETLGKIGGFDEC